MTHSLSGHLFGGVRYVGEFKEGRVEGVGTYHFDGIIRFKGQWLNSKRHGKGTEFGRSVSQSVGRSSCVAVVIVVGEGGIPLPHTAVVVVVVSCESMWMADVKKLCLTVLGVRVWWCEGMGLPSTTAPGRTARGTAWAPSSTPMEAGR